MTDGMKWFGVVTIGILFLVMMIFVIVSSSAPGIYDPIQSKVNSYTDCLRHTPTGWGGLSDQQVQTCKDLSGWTTP